MSADYLSHDNQAHYRDYSLEEHERALASVSQQHERWSAIPRSQLTEIYKRYRNELGSSPLSSPDDALLLWHLLSLEIGADIRGGWNTSEASQNELESVRKRRYLQKWDFALSRQLPQFAAYLKEFGDISPWTTEDWEQLLQGMGIMSLPYVVHFLFYGLGKPKDFVSGLTRSQYVFLSSGHPEGVQHGYLIPRILPCVDEDTSLYLVRKILDANEYHLEQVVIGVPSSEISPLLLSYFFSDFAEQSNTDGAVTKYTITYDDFNGTAEYLWESMERGVPEKLQTEIIQHMFNGRFTDLQRETFAHERRITDSDGELIVELPFWDFRQPTEREEQAFEQWLEEKYDQDYWRGRKRSRMHEFEDQRPPPKRQKRVEEGKRPPYQHAVYGDDESLRISKHTVVWDPQLLNNTSVCSLRIPEVEELHYEALIGSPTFCKQLKLFHAGNNDTGKGSTITPDTLVRFVQLCPNITDLKLESHCLADRTVFEAVLQSCPNIKFLGITGNDAGKGSLKPTDFELLSKEEKWPDLVELFLVDQNMYPYEPLKAIVQKRPQLAITKGETAGDSIAAQMIASFSSSSSDRILGSEAPTELMGYAVGADANDDYWDAIAGSFPGPDLYDGYEYDDPFFY